MRRSLLTALGTVALALAVPGAALAHDGHEGHHHHRGHHHHSFHRVHVGKGAGGPVAPANAGTVASYANNVLTLTLTDGSSLSGKVTDFTRIKCIPAAPVAATPEEMNDHDFGDDRGGPGFEGSKGSWHDKGDQSDKGDGPPISSEPPCDTSALVAGAVVRAAELRVGPSGSEFESVWLVR